jgi:phenylpropionate dioxygenase-like ring-hydroxylating dioxygenase large terminal subunit
MGGAIQVLVMGTAAMNEVDVPHRQALNRLEFDHWHPILDSGKLKRSPVAVRLHGTEIALFRTKTGQIGALENCCPHRRMKLSLGRVINDRLQCMYHGWTFDCQGRGESPGTPKLHATARRFEALDRHGVIWIKSAHSQPDFPQFPNFAEDRYFHLFNLHHQVNAPLEVTVDNFCEIEHTPTTHAFFGYALDTMHQVQVQFEATPKTVRVINQGPPKRMAAIYRALLGVRDNFLFYDDWTTFFSPVYSVYEHWWADPSSSKESMVRWKLFIFFTPRDEKSTHLTTMVYTKSRYPGPAGCMRAVRWLLRRKIDQEIRLDVRILESLADQSANLEGMKLSRFDKVLAMNRDRINGVYRGLGIQQFPDPVNGRARTPTPAGSGDREGPA